MNPILSSGALLSPSVARNRDPILAVLREELPSEGLVLEIASGTGEHAAHFATALPTLTWQPTDRDQEALVSIAAHREETDALNLLSPVRLDAASPDWPLEHADAMVAINMIHISPWSSAEGLMRGAARLLPPGAPLVLYGPYREREVETAPSNEAFDASLKARNPEWGLRELDEVTALAARNGLRFARRIAMPANNLTVVFRRAR